MLRRIIDTEWRDAALAVVMAVAILAGIVLGQITRPSPPAVPVASPQTDFSAERALAHVREIATKPHPLGTRENIEVGNYIIRQIEALGLKPEVQETSVTSRTRSSDYVIVRVRNILTRIEGSEGGVGNAVLLSAHYDSVPGSPGAADDAAGVAVLFESMRAILEGSKPANDIIFLFTDGEELGCYGAKAFVAEHPWSKEVAIALNFDARGTTGPAMMFETGNEDGWLAHEFLRIAPRPYANSFVPVLFKFMPNATDFGVLRQAGISGLNFAFAEGWQRYHSGGDKADNLDARTLQHQGEYALAMARRLSGIDFSRRPRYSGTYFNAVGPVWVFYPTSWAPLISVFIIIVYLLALYLARRRGQLSWRGAALSMAVSIGAILVAALPAPFILGSVARRVGGGPLVYASGYVYAAVIAYSVTVFVIALRLCRKRASMISVFLGAMAIWVILALAVTIVAPAAAYVLQWPALLACILSLGIVLYGGGEVRKTGLVIASVVAAVGIGLLLVPHIDLLHVALPMQVWWSLCAVAALSLIVLIPQLDSIIRVAGWRVPAVTVVIAAAFVVAAAMTRYDNQHPKPNHVFYVANADTNTAIWLTRDNSPDAWTSQFFPNPVLTQSVQEYLPDWYTGGPRGRDSQMLNTAPFVINDPPEASVISAETVNGIRRVSLRVRSLKAAPNVSVRVFVQGGILQAAAGGEQPDDLTVRIAPLSYNNSEGLAQETRKETVFSYFGLSTTGATLTVETNADDKIELEVIEISYDLPPPAEGERQARPLNVFQARSYIDTTVVRRSFVF